MSTFNVAIVDDERPAAAALQALLSEYANFSDYRFNAIHFNKSLTFLNNMNRQYDIIFMDIEMPEMSGYDLSRRIREHDEVVKIIFVTNMAQYAVKGYAVNAFDFLVKPVLSGHFVQVMDRALRNIEKQRSEPEITVSTENSGMVRLKARDILYIEVLNHHCLIHSRHETAPIQMYGSLKDIEGQLIPHGFARCNNCYLVNFRHIAGVKGFVVTVGDKELQISHPKRKDFMRELTSYLGTNARGE